MSRADELFCFETVDHRGDREICCSATQAKIIIRELEAEFEQALRPWPPSGPERNVECVRFVESTNQWFVCSSTQTMYLADEVFFRELPEGGAV